MRNLTLSIVLILFFSVTGHAADSLEVQLQNQAERITQLENRLEELEHSLRAGQLTTEIPEQPPSDDLIGKWDCTDGAYRTEIYFEQGGRMLQKEAFLGTTKNNRWTRVGTNKLSLPGGESFKLDFYSRNQLTVEDTNTRSIWTCDRLDN